jgi:hypothetical protein
MPSPNPRWKRLAAAAALAAWLLAPAAARAGERLPNLTALPPADIALEVTAEGRHLIRFTQGFANTGPGHLLVQGVDTGNGEVIGYQQILDEHGDVMRSVPITTIIFHPQHKHWHARDVATYELHRGSPWGPLAAKNGKISYCLVDEEPLEGYTGEHQYPRYLNCEQSSQGITPGYVDVYRADLYDQWVDVTEQRDGVFYLVAKGDPEGIYIQTDTSDDLAWTKVELSDGVRQVRVMAPDEALLRLNGERLELPVRTRVADGHALAHVRLAERLGASVEWDGARVIIRKDGKRLEITPDEGAALVDGALVEMGIRAQVADDRVLVPVRFLCDQLGARVTYDWLASTVNIEQP